MHSKYLLPKEVYHQTLWFIRRYRSFKDQVEALLEGSPLQDGQPRGTDPGDPTGSVAVKVAELSSCIKAIESAAEQIPEEYRAYILAWVVDRIYPTGYASPKTWERYRRRFVYFVARNAGFY